MKKIYNQMKTFALLCCMAGGQLNAQLNGVYTIDAANPTSGTNYQTFGAFAADINSQGVNGPVTVNVVSNSGPYNEQVTISQIPGASATNTITINGNGNVLTFASNNSSQRYTLLMNGADFFHIHNLTVVGNGSYAWALVVTGNADDNQYTACTFSVSNSTSSNYISVLFSGSSSSQTYANSGNRNRFTNCDIVHGYYGTYMIGPTSGAYASDNGFYNCRFTDFYVYGIYTYYQRGLTLKGNTVSRPTRTSNTTIYGIMSYYNQGAMIDGNRIMKLTEMNQTTTSSVYGMYIYWNSAGGGNPNFVQNNVISDIRHNGTLYGMQIMYLDGLCSHNTVSLDHAGATGGSTYGIYTYATNGYPVDFRNNNVSVTRGGNGAKYGIYYLITGNITSDYNNFYVLNAGTGANYVGYYNNTNYGTLAQFQSAGQEMNSYDLDPQFNNPATLDYSPTNVNINNKATPVGVVLDINLNPRSGTAPDIGAFEFLSTPCSGTPTAGSIVTPTYQLCAGESANLILSNFSSDLGITYQWSHSNVSTVGPWTVIPNANTVLYNTPGLTNTMYYQVVVTCTNGGQSVNVAAQVVVAGITTSVVPYFESFEGIPRNNKLPNCSWSADDLGSNALTYTASNTLGRTPKSGSKFASFYYNPGGTRSYYTNGIWLDANITYSASVWFQTEYYGYNNWTDLSILVGPNQNATGQQTVASTNGPAISNVYKSLSNTFQVTSSGIYYVAIRATGSTGSSAQYLSWDDLLIEIPCSLNSPTMTLTSNQSTICANDPSGVTISATGANSYSWSTGENTGQVTVFPNIPGNITYYVTGTNTLTNCKQTLSQMVVVNPAPNLNAFANPPVVCSGSPVNLHAFGAASFLWTNSSTGGVVTVNPANTGTYGVSGTNQYGCTSNATVQVLVNQLPSISAQNIPELACVGDIVVFDPTGASNYQFVSSNLYLTVSPANVQLTSAGVASYTIYGTDNNGCQGMEDYQIVVEECTGLGKHALSGSVRVYPNPTSGLLTIELGQNAGHIEVADVTGRVVMSAESNAAVMNLDLNQLAGGLYYVKVKTVNRTETVQVIRQ